MNSDQVSALIREISGLPKVAGGVLLHRGHIVACHHLGLTTGATPDRDKLLMALDGCLIDALKEEKLKELEQEGKSVERKPAEVAVIQHGLYRNFLGKLYIVLGTMQSAKSECSELETWVRYVEVGKTSEYSIPYTEFVGLVEVPFEEGHMEVQRFELEVDHE